MYFIYNYEKKKINYFPLKWQPIFLCVADSIFSVGYLNFKFLLLAIRRSKFEVGKSKVMHVVWYIVSVQ